MFRIFAGGLSALALSAAASALTPQEDMAARCVEEGNDAAQCACAAEVIVDTLEENEIAFMMEMMGSQSEDPQEMLSVAASHGLDMGGVVAIGQKMAAAEPQMREQCGLDDADDAEG